MRRSRGWSFSRLWTAASAAWRDFRGGRSRQRFGAPEDVGESRPRPFDAQLPADPRRPLHPLPPFDPRPPVDLHRPLVPRPAGEVAPNIVIAAADANAGFRRAFAAAAGALRPGAAEIADVVWVDGDNELLVRSSRLQIVFRAGFVLVGVPVFTEQTGDVEIVVPFALGRPDAPLGLVAATETRPRGPATIVDWWGDLLIAAAWRALLQMAADAAAAAGVDDARDKLIPAALIAHEHGLTVTPQARHLFDRTRA